MLSLGDVVWGLDVISTIVGTCADDIPSVYRTLSQAIDNSDCVHIPALDVPAGVALNTVISDSDDYEAVLPLGAVKTVSIYQTAKPPAAAQDRPASAAAIVAAVTGQWQRASSATPPSLPAVGPGASLASPGPAAAPSITPGAVQRGAPVNPAALGGSSTGAMAAPLAAGGPASAPGMASGPVQNGAPIFTGASTQSGGTSMVGSMAQGGNAPVQQGQVAAASSSGSGGEKAGQVQVSQMPGGSAGQPVSSLGNQRGSGGVDLPPYPDYG